MGAKLVVGCGYQVTRDSVRRHCFHPGDPSVELVTCSNKKECHPILCQSMLGVQYGGGGGMARGRHVGGRVFVGSCVRS